MFRKKIAIKDENFRLRGEEIFRIEALSDAVFAFSVSILAMSLEVPQTFEELSLIINGAVPFIATVSIIFILWYNQHSFFRHYGLNDLNIIVLNLAYLALILFYVYPLKFLFSVLIASWTGINLFPEATEKGLNIITKEEFPQLIMLFSLGYMLIWFLILLMHQRALKLSALLKLTKYEICYTKAEIRGAFFNALIGLFSIVLAWKHYELLSGICYLLIPFVLMLNKGIFRYQLSKQKMKESNEVHIQPG